MKVRVHLPALKRPALSVWLSVYLAVWLSGCLACLPACLPDCLVLACGLSELTVACRLSPADIVWCPESRVAVGSTMRSRTLSLRVVGSIGGAVLSAKRRRGAARSSGASSEGRRSRSRSRICALPRRCGSPLSLPRLQLGVCVVRPSAPAFPLCTRDPLTLWLMCWLCARG